MLKAREIMSRPVVALPPEMRLRDAMELFVERHISGAPVVSRGRVVGIVSATDLLGFAAFAPGVPTEHEDVLEWGGIDEIGEPLPEGEDAAAYYTDFWQDAGADVAERLDAVDGPEWNVLEEHVVSEVMSRPICWVPPDLAVPAVADYMTRYDVHRVLVMQRGELLGVITASDIARAVAQRRLVLGVSGAH